MSCFETSALENKMEHSRLEDVLHKHIVTAALRQSVAPLCYGLGRSGIWHQADRFFSLRILKLLAEGD